MSDKGKRDWAVLITRIVIGGFIAFVAFAFIVPYLSSGTCCKPPAAMTQMAIFQTALDVFQIDNGFYPSGTNGLRALVEKPLGATNWQGPYIKTNAVPKDPWGHDYLYFCPGTRNTDSFDLYSLGPSGNPRKTDEFIISK